MIDEGVEDSFVITSDHIVKAPSQKEVLKNPDGLGQILFKKLPERGDTIMQIDGISMKQETYQEVFVKSRRLAIHMQLGGIVPNDIITICTHNTLESVLPLISSLFLGAIVNTLDPSFTESDFKYFLDYIKPKIIFISQEKEDVILKTVLELKMETKIVVFEKMLNKYLEPATDEELFKPNKVTHCRDTAMILFSSGSTGKPKGICLNHSCILNFCYSPFYIGYERVLNFASLGWIIQVNMTLSSIIRGFVKIVYPKYDGSPTLTNLIEKYKINTVALSVLYLTDLIDYCRYQKIILKHLDTVFVIGTLLTEKYLRMAIEIFPCVNFINSYGQTECGIITTYERHKQLASEIKTKLLNNSCGKIVPGKLVKVVNLETEENVGPNEVGEIRIGGLYIMNGYYGVDSSEAFDSFGWVKTGDLGYYDLDGYIYIAGRCKDMLKFRAMPVYPAVLEEILAKHPAVKNCVVTGIPHEIDGDHSVAFVTLQDGMIAEPSEIQKFFDDQVDYFKKLRRGVIIIDKIPLSPTGKPNKILLREMLMNKKL